MFTLLRRGRESAPRPSLHLPAGYFMIPLTEGQIVVGPTGAFALTEAGTDIERAAERIARVAGELRDILVRELSWAPFVDPVVIVDDGADRSRLAAVVPRRLLHTVLTGGASHLAVEQVERIAGALADAEHRPHS